MGSSTRYATAANATVTDASGRTYTANSSGIVDVPHPRQVHGQAAFRLIEIGATSDRPVPISGAVDRPPRAFYDTTLDAPIFWTGSAWIRVDGSAA
jgi:hypothetical protein